MTTGWSGKSTEQIKSAPFNAVYIWPNLNLSYPRLLAKNLDRPDLKIESAGWLENMRNWRGCRFGGVVLDHACWLTNEQSRGLVSLQKCVVPNRRVA